LPREMKVGIQIPSNDGCTIFIEFPSRACNNAEAGSLSEFAHSKVFLCLRECIITRMPFSWELISTHCMTSTVNSLMTYRLPSSAVLSFFT
jgi:hypothetical protein